MATPMTMVAGIDPGSSGACAVYCTDTKRVAALYDLPTWYMTVGKKKRKRIDVIGVKDMFEELNIAGVELVVMEAVGGRTGQSASAGFVFGYGVGILYMACMYAEIMMETVPPGHWKKLMNVPGKSRGTDDDILARADEMFPHDRELFRGSRGGRLIDRAEAAMLGKFGGDFILGTMNFQKGDEEYRLAYRNAETGA